MRRVLALILLLALFSGSLQFPIERVTAMVITDLDNDFVDDYVFACHKIVSDPWDRGVIYVYEGNKLQWYYHLSAIIKDIEVYDLDFDGKKEIIAVCDVRPEKNVLGDKGVLYIFDGKGKLEWRRWLPGTPKSLYCYQNNVAVNLYGQGERVMIFNSEGRRIRDLPVNGDISKFEIRDINNDGKYELIVANIVNNKWEHFFVVYNLSGGVIWNYDTFEHINDFLFYDIDNDGTQETLLGAYNVLYITRGGDLLGKIELPPPILHVKVIGDQILVCNSNTMFLISIYNITLLGGETVPVTGFSQLVDAALQIPLPVKPKFLFLRDTDFDETDEIIVGNGDILEIYESSEFSPPETIITVPAVTAERLITFLTYENARVGVKVDYPRNWTIEEDIAPGLATVAFLSPREGISDTFLENVSITVETLPQPVTLGEYTETAINTLRQDITNFTIIESVSTTLGDNPAYELISTGEVEGVGMKWMQIWTIKGNKAYVFTYSALSYTYSRFQQVVEDMADSFEIVTRLYAVSICAAQPDAPGEDNDNLNGEWIKICNDGDTDIDMSGWEIVNDMGNFYEIPDGFILKAGSFVFVYTGSGTDTENSLYWGNPVEVWNNFGDLLTLLDNEGNTVLEYELIPQ